MKPWNALLISLAAPLLCAQSPSQPMLPPVSRNVFYEAFAHRSADTALSRVTVSYRIDLEFFMVQREAAEGTRGAFERRGEIMIELFDRSGTSRAREVRPLRRLETGNSERPGDIRWIEGAISFTVVPDEYQVLFEITDLQSQNRFLDRARKLDTRQPRENRPAVTGATFMASGPQAPAALQPLNFGGDLILSRPALLYLELTGLPDSSARVKCEFAPLDRERRPLTENPPIVDTSPVLLQSVLLQPPDSSTVPAFRIGPDSSARGASLLVMLPTERLLLRTYRMALTLSAGSREARYERQVRVVWPDMPASLRNVDYALSALRYITSPEVLDSLSSGSFEERRDNLEAFWLDKDTEKRTPYNRFMIQYYQRVDYASTTFGTLRQPDGLLTDRAKIHILYGPPSRTERSLDPAGGYQETWYYDRLKKIFVFEDQLKNGSYLLRQGQ